MPATDAEAFTAAAANVSQQAVATSRARLAAAEARLRASGNAARDTRVLAPAGGIIDKRLVEGGVMMQWIPYGQTINEYKAHIRAFHAVFPEVAIVFGAGGYGN